MFDPSKLKVDFSDTSDVGNIEKKKKAEVEKKKEEAKAVVEPVPVEPVQDVLEDITPTQGGAKAEKDTILLEKNNEVDTKEAEVEEPQLELKEKKDTSLLATIITDSELVEKNKDLKALKEEREKSKEDLENPDNRVVDINITKIDDIVSIMLREKYDYVRIEPNDDLVKVVFVKDSVDKDTKFVKYPTYSNILIAMKNAGGLKLATTDTEQKGKKPFQFLDKKYDTIVKTKPSEFGEKVYFKVEESSAVGAKKKKEKIGFAKIMWFLVAMLLATMILGGMFLGFILFNSNTIADLRFFNDLGVDVDKVREFVSMLVNIIFFTIVFIETIFAIIYIFKAILTKKEYKKKKTTSAILAVFLLIITLVTGFLWLTLSKKVAELKGLNYGKPIIYDNAKLLSNFYDSDRDAIINAEAQLIGPITLKFDVSEYLEKLRDDGDTPKKLTWTFDDEVIEKPAESTELIKEFDTLGLNSVDLLVDITNLAGEDEQKELEVARLDLGSMVEINAKSTASGGKTFSFDARGLRNLGQIEWYYIPDLNGKEGEEKLELITQATEQPIIEGYTFSPQKVLFDEEILVGMFIDSKGKVKNDLDKIFIVGGDGESDIEGEINLEPSIKSDLIYEFFLSDLDNSFGNGFIDTVLWNITGKEIEKIVDITDVENSTKVEHEFKEYGENRVLATLTDTNGNTRIIEKTVNIAKTLALKKVLDIYNNESDDAIGRYNKKTFEYDINDLATPTELRLDARFVSSSNQLFALEKVEWDFDADGSIDEAGDLVTHKIETVGNHHIIVHYTFEHRSIPGNTIKMTEDIYIDSLKKDVILDLKIEKESNYVPQIVRFDASRSEVQGDDIEKFIYDYGDGTPVEERDAINPGHKYLKAGNYTVKLTAKTKKGEEYTITKQLNLLDRPQEIVMESSLKRTKVYQEINFSSDKSNGQITSYFWEFGDGDYSTVANPIKSFDKPGKYTVKLTGTFANNNVETDEIDITIEE